MTPNLSVDLCGVTLKNPVMVASGTFGAGEEFSQFLDLNRLGAVVTKGVALAGQSDPAYLRDAVRDAECHRPAESGIRSVREARLEVSGKL